VLSRIFAINIVTCIPIARQRLGKYIPAQANSCKNRTSIASQLVSKHNFLMIETVFSAWSVQSGYKEVFGNIEMTLTNDRPVLSSERAPHINNRQTVIKIWS
jgi:hypothetical protein